MMPNKIPEIVQNIKKARNLSYKRLAAELREGVSWPISYEAIRRWSIGEDTPKPHYLNLLLRETTEADWRHAFASDLLAAITAPDDVKAEVNHAEN